MKQKIHLPAPPKKGDTVPGSDGLVFENKIGNFESLELWDIGHGLKILYVPIFQDKLTELERFLIHLTKVDLLDSLLSLQKGLSTLDIARVEIKVDINSIT